MLTARIIEPSFSEWSSPIVMMKKPNGKYRFCLDFRKVNSVEEGCISVAQYERYLR